MLTQSALNRTYAHLDAYGANKPHKFAGPQDDEMARRRNERDRLLDEAQKEAEKQAVEKDQGR